MRGSNHDKGLLRVVSRPERWHARAVNIRIIPSLVLAGLMLTACGNDDAATPDVTTTVTASSAPATAPATTPATTTTTTGAPEVPLPEVVVTYSVLASAVAPLLDGVATIRVIIPNGQDPHDYAPSAKDVEAMSKASLIIANGLDLEEALVDVIDRLEGDGVPVFRVADHVTLLELGDDDDGHGHDDDHGTEDPHIWTDPATLAEMLPALGLAVAAALDVDLDAAVTASVGELMALDAEVRAVMGAVTDCVLVTGHDSMQYFARQYGCEVIGAVIPSLSTGAEASAGELAALRKVAQQAGVKAIFTELGTPARVAEQVAAEVGVPLVELSTHVVPDASGYSGFVMALARNIALALS